MARERRLVWAAPALDDLDEIAAWIALEDEAAARRLVQRTLATVERLRRFPASGRRVPEVPEGRFREVLVPPCRVIYRVEGGTVFIVHVFRAERLARAWRLL